MFFLMKPVNQFSSTNDHRLNTNCVWTVFSIIWRDAEHSLWLCTVAPWRQIISVAYVLNFEQHPCNFLLAGQTRSWGKCLSKITISCFISLCLLSASLAESASEVWLGRDGGGCKPSQLYRVVRSIIPLFTAFLQYCFTPLPLWHWGI